MTRSNSLSRPLSSLAIALASVVPSFDRAAAILRRIAQCLAIVASAHAFAGNLTLAWDPVAATGVSGYVVSYGSVAGSYTGSVDVGNVTTATLGNLADGGTYHFAVQAYDAAGVRSPYSGDVTGTVPQATPVANFSASTTSGPAPLALNFVNTSTGSITGYSWSFGDGTSSTSANPAKTYSTPGTYTVSLTVSGSGGSNTKTMPNLITVGAAGDTVAPSAPGSLTATAAAGPSVNLAWGAATDNVGVTGYQVERCQGTCTSYTRIATSAGTSYTDTAVAAGTTYVYRVRATDAAGNVGSYSPSATVTPPSSAASGSLSTSLVTATASINVTSDGTVDWVVWPSGNRKSGGAGGIAYATQGGINDSSYRGDARSLTWTNGSPTASGSTTDGLEVIATPGAGFRVTLPAGTTTRTVRVYVGGAASTGKIVATLSDGSAPNYTTTAIGNRRGSFDGVATVTYRAASEGQTLTLQWVCETTSATTNRWRSKSTLRLQGLAVK